MTARTATLTWLMLVGATLLGWLFAGGGASGTGRIAGLVLISAIKIYLVMAIFMGLRHAPFAWHGAAVVWIAATALAIFGLSVSVPL